MSNYKFNGIGTNLSNLATLSDAKTRSISPENFDGAKGKAGMATEGTGAGSVSYTHLDVYKRQSKHCSLVVPESGR